MSDYAQYLAALTAVQPWRSNVWQLTPGEQFFCNLGEFTPPAGANMLAGVDAWVTGPATSNGYLLLEIFGADESEDPFTCLPFAFTGYGSLTGVQLSWRGGIVLGPLEDLLVQYIQVGGTGCTVQGVAWGYALPTGWSPVGMMPQQ